MGGLFGGGAPQVAAAPAVAAYAPPEKVIPRGEGGGGRDSGAPLLPGRKVAALATNLDGNTKTG